MLQLNEIPGLAERMATLMCLEDSIIGYDTEKAEAPSVQAVVQSAKAEAEKWGREVLWLELDELGITDEALLKLDLPTIFPVRTSSWSNLLSRTHEY